MAATRATTKHDVALGEVHRKAARELAIIRAASIVLGIAASALPIYALKGLVEPLAGKSTIVDVDVVVSVSLAASLVVNGFQYLKGRSQRSELERVRDRLGALEAGQA
jgi:hypothetical protein